jgi:hypothetical protein
MKGLIAQRLVLRMFMTLLLTFSVQGIADALIPDVIIPIVPLRMPEPTREGTTVPIAAKDNIAISEIMYATSTDKLPQWIELHNRSTRRVSLEGWKVTIRNHSEDTTVLATNLTLTLDAKILDADQVLLLVTEQGDNSGVGEAKGTLRADNIVILKDLIGGTPNYRLLSQTAFKVTLKAPVVTKIGRKRKILSEIAGNLGAIPEWELPLIEGNQRSSIIREYDSNDITASPYDGTRADGWELASEKGYQYTQGTAYYGHHSDHGTPGYREAAPLPVELSGFRPARGKSSKFRLAREKPTGVIIITWTTQSEMNNTGFFIKRSQRRDGESKIINATMIPGAGTTHEKQFYTYTDTTAQPNVVYYYQLECVSVDGTRRTLTRPIRLRGHIGSSGRRIPYILWAD